MNEKLIWLPDFDKNEYLALIPIRDKTYYSPLHYNTDKVDLIKFYHNLFFKRPVLVEYWEYPWGSLYFQAWKNSNTIHYYIYIFWKHENRLDDFWFYL